MLAIQCLQRESMVLLRTEHFGVLQIRLYMQPHIPSWLFLSYMCCDVSSSFACSLHQALSGLQGLECKVYIKLERGMFSKEEGPRGMP